MQKAINYPRVLLIGVGFNTYTPGGITFVNLFKGWPKNQLAVAAIGKDYIGCDVCDNYYLLGSLEDHWIWPFNYIKRTGNVSGPFTTWDPYKQNFADNKTPKPTLMRGLFYTILNALGINDLVKRLEVSNQFFEWAEAFSPDLIFCTLSTLKLIRFVDNLSLMMQLPSVVHMMDDWPSTIYRQGLFSPYMRWRTDIEFRRLIARSTALGISQAMCDEYKVRYGKEFIPFHNPVDLNIWVKNSKKTWKTGSPFKVRYGGRIGTAIHESVIDIAEAIEEINESGIPVLFDLYIDLDENEFIKKISKYKSAIVHPKLPYEQVPISTAEADLLVIPYDFDNQSIRFIQYSMATKVSEFMASGTPILVYAPEQTAVVKYALSNKWGSVVSQRNKPLLKQMIIQLIQTPGLRESLGRQAQALATRNHDALKVREQFRRVLTETAERGIPIYDPRF